MKLTLDQAIEDTRNEIIKSGLLISELEKKIKANEPFNWQDYYYAEKRLSYHKRLLIRLQSMSDNPPPIPMTVKKLIEKLSEYPEDMPVVADGETGYFYPVVERVDNLTLNDYGDDYVGNFVISDKPLLCELFSAVFIGGTHLDEIME